jgi:hypothetical protein
MIIGSSQNFFLTRRNSQSSLKSDIPFSGVLLPAESNFHNSERPLKPFFCLPRVFARNPVALASFRPTIQRIVTKQLRDEAIGRDDQIEQQKEQHPAVDVAENQRHFHPGDVKRTRGRWNQQSRDHQRQSNPTQYRHDGDPMAIEIPRRKQQQNACDDQRSLARLLVVNLLSD